MKFLFIQQQSELGPVGPLCRILGVSRSGAYAAVAATPKPAAQSLSTR